MASVAVLPNASVSLTSPKAPRATNQPVRRRPTPQQGQALSILGHAIEYLIDSRLPEGGTELHDNQAVRLMMAASRAVFEECPAVVPLSHRMTMWLSQRTARRSGAGDPMQPQLR